MSRCKADQQGVEAHRSHLTCAHMFTLGLAGPIRTEGREAYNPAVVDLSKYQTGAEAAKRLGISDSQLRRLCAQGRVPGAVKLANRWFVPKDAVPRPQHFGRPPTWTSS